MSIIKIDFAMLILYLLNCDNFTNNVLIFLLQYLQFCLGEILQSNEAVNNIQIDEIKKLPAFNI